MTGLRAEAVLFDKDGTLFDFNATWVAWSETMLDVWSEGNAGRKRDLAGAIGFDLEAHAFLPSSVAIAGTSAEVADAVARVLGVPPDSLVDRLNAEAAAAPMAEAVPLRPLCAELRRMGLRLGVATNDSEAPARAHLSAAGIEGEFAFIAGADSGFGAKPGPGQLQAFAAHVGIAPDRIAMVGDSTHDLRAGRAAGMQTIGVLTGLAAQDVLAPFADAVFPDIGFLTDWLRDT